MKRSGYRMQSLWQLGVVCALAVMLVGCGGGADESGNSTVSGSRSVAIEPLFAVLDNDGRQVLGTAEGFSLYIFDGDGLNESKCLEVCALTFIPFQPPAEGENRSAGDGVDIALVSQFERSDGINQVSYAGRALYRFSADVEPGDSSGEGSAGRWFLVGPDGSRVPRN